MRLGTFAVLLGAALALPIAAQAQGTISNGQSVTGGNSAGGSGLGGNAAGGNAEGGQASSNTSANVQSNVPRQAPNVALALATAYCQNNGGITGSGAGFSFGAALGRHDVDCKRLNYALFLQAAGRADEALALIMNNDEVREAFNTAARWREERAKAALPVSASVASAPAPRYCQRMRGEGVQDRLMREANCRRG